MSEEKEAVVVGRDIVKTFKDFWGRDKVKALRGVDLDIYKGSVFGLLGPNGAGKSTIIKLMLGHLFPTSGKIAVFGKDPRDVSVKFKIGYLPERSYLYKNLTAKETLRYFGEILNLSKEQIESRSEQLLEMVGLQNAKNRFVGEFSHGMTRRMGLAQALLNDPDFIILDEPTAGLDPVGCREVKDLIITLGRRGKTILLTSHLLADVEDTCDEVMMIFGGKVQSKGKLEVLLAEADRVKLEFPRIDNETINQVRDILAPKCQGDLVISSPKQSLESYFLSVVNEGNKTQETSGAKTGSGVAEYLRGDLPKVEKVEKVEVKPKVVEEKRVEKSEPVKVLAPVVIPEIIANNKVVEEKAVVEEKVVSVNSAVSADVRAVMENLRAGHDEEIQAEMEPVEVVEDEKDEKVDEDLLKNLNL